jgi:hypothetical protein
MDEGEDDDEEDRVMTLKQVLRLRQPANTPTRSARADTPYFGLSGRLSVAFPL